MTRLVHQPAPGRTRRISIRVQPVNVGQLAAHNSRSSVPARYLRPRWVAVWLNLLGRCRSGRRRRPDRLPAATGMPRLCRWPCRSSRRPSAARSSGPPVRSPIARSITRAVRGAGGMVTTLPPLRPILDGSLSRWIDCVLSAVCPVMGSPFRDRQVGDVLNGDLVANGFPMPGGRRPDARLQADCAAFAGAAARTSLACGEHPAARGSGLPRTERGKGKHRLPGGSMLKSISLAALAALTVTVSACASTQTVTHTVTKTIPGPTMTVTVPGPTVTAKAAPAPTVTVTVKEGAAPNPSASNTSPAILSYSGSGIWTSQPFNAPSEIIAAYSFSSCDGGSGNFIADVITTADPSSGNYDDQTVANQLSSGGSATTAVYPQYPGSQYDLQVNSECSFTIKLTSG